jgi:hypothetical protein
LGFNRKNIAKTRANLKYFFCFFALLFSAENLFAQENSSIVEKLKQIDYTQEIMNLNVLDSNSDFVYTTIGTASFYGKRFQNRKTASGEIFNMNDYTAAHKTLPFGTILKVTNIQNKKSVIVRINDRGPFVSTRILDLSQTAAEDIESNGLPTVSVEGFIPKKNLDYDLRNFDDYIFGYSLSYPLLCLHKSVLSLVAMTNSFNEAVKILKQFTGKHPNVVSYLLVPANQLLKNINKDDDFYYIAMILPEKAITMKEFSNILK